MSNFLLGGRMGDLIHQLWVCKNTPGKHRLFITDRRDLHSDGFVFSLQQTINELLPILKHQSWFGSIEILDNVTSVSNGQEHVYAYGQDILNLNIWRRYAYSACWTQLMANTFNMTPNGEPWLTVPEIRGWDEDIVLHCSVHAARRGNWNIIMDKYSGVFVGNGEEYRLFNYPVPLHPPKDLMNHFQIINSCKFFIGNQSAPLAMAHALGKPRLAMLNEVDKLHYTGEEKWHKNFYWIAEHEHYYEGINF